MYVVRWNTTQNQGSNTFWPSRGSVVFPWFVTGLSVMQLVCGHPFPVSIFWRSPRHSTTGFAHTEYLYFWPFCVIVQQTTGPQLFVVQYTISISMLHSAIPPPQSTIRPAYLSRLWKLHPPQNTVRPTNCYLF